MIQNFKALVLWTGLLPGTLLTAGDRFTLTALDTLYPNREDSTLILSHNLVVDSTFQLFRAGVLVRDFELDPVRGMVKLADPDTTAVPYLAGYTYLAIPLPLRIEPAFLSLPPLDSGTERSPAPDSGFGSPVPGDTGFRNELLTAGSIYRGIDLNPLGGTDLSGGLRLQLQGRLGNDLQVSGVLSDQNFPIQPEGNTQSLEEIDQIYINIRHPSGTVTAGDLDLVLTRGSTLRIERQLLGLKGDFQTESYGGQAVFAGSKGSYHQIGMKGSEGYQGPYFLASETGNRDIIVVAGSERVWVDGERQVRGENNDYTIDYSTGEITFTPRRLIHSDTDLLFEFQYLDFVYNQNLIGLALDRKLGPRGKLAAAYLYEYDRVPAGQPADQLQVLRLAGDGDALAGGAVADSLGDYYFIDGRYVYYELVDPDSHTTRYRVSFHNDVAHGSYIKRVSASGRLYYHYLEEDGRNATRDLYSPVKILPKPRGLEILNLTGEYSSGNQVLVTTELALSRQDQNTLSPLNDNDNLGHALAINLSGKNIPLPLGMALGYRTDGWLHSRTFRPLQRDREVLFQRDWDLESGQYTEEGLVSTGLDLTVGELQNLRVDWSRYIREGDPRTRVSGRFEGQGYWVPELSLFLNNVTARRSPFRQNRARLVLLPGQWHPFLNFQAETRPGLSRFEHLTAGLLFETEYVQGRTSLGRRTDQWDLDSTRAGLEPLSTGIFGALEMGSNRRRSWRWNVTYQKRLKEEHLPVGRIDMDLLQANVNYQDRDHPLRWDLKTKLEESYTESRVLVYDSVGTGLGGYRYDPVYNEYIPDPNGAWLAHTVLTGDRFPATRFEGTQRCLVDFGRTGWNRLQAVDVILEMRADYQGTRFGNRNLWQGRLTQEHITRARWNWRGEVDVNPLHTRRRWRQWMRRSRDLNGLDPRGNDLKQDQEIGLEWTEPLGGGWQSVSSTTLKNSAVKSSFSELRNRAASGFWLETAGKWASSRVWQFETFLAGGEDRGTHRQGSFAVQAAGGGCDILRFVGSRGRLQTRLEWFVVEDLDGRGFPPEAVQGMAAGDNYRLTLTGQVLVGSNLSANLNANYISNAHYPDLVNISGELRAYF